MYIIAFILLIISLSKLFVAMTINKEDLQNITKSIPESNMPGIIAAIITADGLIGLICSIFILGI